MKLTTIKQFNAAVKSEDLEAYRIARTEILAQIKVNNWPDEEKARHLQCVRQSDAFMFKVMQKQNKVTKGVKFRN